MSNYYNPDPDATSTEQQDDEFVIFLSQRDVSLKVPINFVTYPGAVLTPACFANGRYQEVAAEKCISNLLATGFRRLRVDVYWDVSRSIWSLCPVQLGNTTNDTSTTSSSSATPTLSYDTSTRLASESLSRNNAARSAFVGDVLFERQVSETATTASSIGGSSTTSAASFSSSGVLYGNPLIPTSLPTSIPPLEPAPTSVAIVSIGPYSCTAGADLELVIKVLAEYFAATETNIYATTSILTLNIHAAASASDPTGPAQAPALDQLPNVDSLLSNVIANNASLYLYTSNELSSQRQSLNTTGSWFAVGIQEQPDSAFFHVSTDKGRVYSPDGWPSEAFVEIQQAKRFLVEFGDIDPQMGGYNFSGDESTIFSSNYLYEPRAVTFDSSQNVASGCFFDADETSVANVNSSFGMATLGSGNVAVEADLENLLLQAQSLTTCGISPLINATLNNATADQSFEAYAAFVGSTVWSWAPDEPKNTSTSPDFANYRCAALNATSGSWQSADCSESLYAACRIADAPYHWQVSAQSVPYDRVGFGCEGNSSFDVPNTALENTYLTNVWRDFKRNSDLMWLNFNDLSVNDCWVIGQNSTCPYQGTPSNSTRQIAVPTAAGVIILVLTIGFVLVKYAGARRNTKRRRRRGHGGWDYEGVPS